MLYFVQSSHSVLFLQTLDGPIFLERPHFIMISKKIYVDELERFFFHIFGHLFIVVIYLNKGQTCE